MINSISKFFKKLIILNSIAVIFLFHCLNCKQDNEKTQLDRKEKENCTSSKFELLLRELFLRTVLFPKITSFENDSILYYLKLKNFALPEKNFYLHITPSISIKSDSIKLILADSNITRGGQVIVEISEKNEDTSIVKVLVNFYINKIPSGVGLYSYEFKANSCSWNMKDSSFSWEY